MAPSSLVPDYDVPARNRRVLLVRRPAGIPQPGDFALDEATVDPLGDGQILVRNIFLSVDPAQRGWVNEGTNYSSPVPVGTTMRALAAGVVVDSRHADFPPGCFVYGWLGWQDLAVVAPEQILTRTNHLRVPLSATAGVLGINGLTAQIALDRIGRPRAGDTLLVTTAAGAVGSVVGQLARMQGCRVLGLTGSAGKVARCVDRFGFDAAFDYHNPSWEQQLAVAAPDGLDVLFDNVGGPILDRLLRRMRVGGRVVQCGTASIANWSPDPTGLRNEREVLTRRLSWGGFVIFDEQEAFPAASEALTRAILVGTLVYDEDIDVGIEHAPGAIQRLYAGENEGKKLIRLV